VTGTVGETARAVAAGESSALEIARAAMAGIVNGESGPHSLNAFISYDYEDALAQAQRVDADVESGAVLSLAGVPIAIKDNICTLGLPTTCASRILAGYRSPYEATVVRRLRAAGALIAGKTNLDEFAMGSSTEQSAFGPTRNPHDPERVPGGSSGGSAAAVAAGLVPAALGSDTGGSVRQPAAFCGVVGFKPSWGAVSRYGLVAFASSLDQVGIIARSPRDAEAVFEVIAGADPRDSTSRDVERPREMQRGATVGIPREYVEDDIDSAVRDAMAGAVEWLRSSGVTVKTVSLPAARFGLQAYTVISSAEAATNLARYDGVRYGTRALQRGRDPYSATRAVFGREVRRRILLGTYVLSADQRERHYALAHSIRLRIAADFRRAFADGCDLLFTPTTPARAFRLGERIDDPRALYATDRFTVGPSLAGLPALSLPLPRQGSLPAGGQLIAPWGADRRLLRLAAFMERWAAC
jgi:aspartyl-tRNA(Asn)/glutamyl-tRNA(Gln) amidotransferase subunit A